MADLLDCVPQDDVNLLECIIWRETISNEDIKVGTTLLDEAEFEEEGAIDKNPLFQMAAGVYYLLAPFTPEVVDITELPRPQITFKDPSLASWTLLFSADGVMVDMDGEDSSPIMRVYDVVNCPPYRYDLIALIVSTWWQRRHKPDADPELLALITPFPRRRRSIKRYYPYKASNKELILLAARNRWYSSPAYLESIKAELRADDLPEGETDDEEDSTNGESYNELFDRLISDGSPQSPTNEGTSGVTAAEQASDATGEGEVE